MTNKILVNKETLQAMLNFSEKHVFKIDIRNNEGYHPRVVMAELRKNIHEQTKKPYIDKNKQLMTDIKRNAKSILSIIEKEANKK